MLKVFFGDFFLRYQILKFYCFDHQKGLFLPSPNIEVGTASSKLNSQSPENECCGYVFMPLLGHRVFICVVLGTERLKNILKTSIL